MNTVFTRNEEERRPSGQDTYENAYQTDIRSEWIVDEATEEATRGRDSRKHDNEKTRTLKGCREQITTLRGRLL